MGVTEDLNAIVGFEFFSFATSNFPIFSLIKLKVCNDISFTDAGYRACWRPEGVGGLSQKQGLQSVSVPVPGLCLRQRQDREASETKPISRQ